MSEVAANVGALPSRFILLSILNEFLWSVSLSDGIGQVFPEHLALVFQNKNWVLDPNSNIVIDLANQAISTKAFLDSAIDKLAALGSSEQTVIDKLNVWADLYTGSPELLVKYNLALSLETDRTACGLNSETQSQSGR